MPEKLLEFLLDLSPQYAKQITAWLEANPFAVEQMISVIGKPTVKLTHLSNKPIALKVGR